MNSSTPSQPSRRRLLTGLALSAFAVPALAACAPEEQNLSANNDGSGKGYIAGDGSVQEYTGDERSAPVEFTGTYFDGTEVTANQWTAKATVLNFWYASCAPCRQEAPTLVKLYSDFKKKDVQFIGINTRDENAAAEAFDRTFSVDYPSFRDLDGQVQGALAQYVPAQATPTTLVLDGERRITARILGVADESTLRSLIQTALGNAA